MSSCVCGPLQAKVALAKVRVNRVLGHLICPIVTRNNGHDVDFFLLLLHDRHNANCEHGDCSDRTHDDAKNRTPLTGFIWVSFDVS